MVEHGFKIGDSVKVCVPIHWSQGHKIGIVTEDAGFYVRVSWEDRNMLYIPSEIYKVHVKGEQLMFSFMSVIEH